MTQRTCASRLSFPSSLVDPPYCRCTCQSAKKTLCIHRCSKQDLITLREGRLKTSTLFKTSVVRNDIILKILSLIVFKLTVNHDNRSFCSISAKRTITSCERIICYLIRWILSVIYIYFFQILNGFRFLLQYSLFWAFHSAAGLASCFACFIAAEIRRSVNTLTSWSTSV